MAERNVSWKQSSAASRPTEATRKRHTSSRWASRKRWNGGRDTAIERLSRRVREIRPRRPRSRGQPAQQRRRAIALLAELDAQPVEHGEDVLGADRLAPLEGAARMVEAEHHPDVDVVPRADALADGEARLVDELGHDAPEHEAWCVVHPDGAQAERREELLDALGGRRRGARPARELDQRRAAERGQ